MSRTLDRDNVRTIPLVFPARWERNDRSSRTLGGDNISTVLQLGHIWVLWGHRRFGAETRWQRVSRTLDGDCERTTFGPCCQCQASGFCARCSVDRLYPDQSRKFPLFLYLPFSITCSQKCFRSCFCCWVYCLALSAIWRSDGCSISSLVMICNNILLQYNC